MLIQFVVHFKQQVMAPDRKGVGNESLKNQGTKTVRLEKERKSADA
jgi:hypothetical protein